MSGETCTGAFAFTVMAPPLEKLPLRDDDDDDLVMEAPRYLSMVSVVLPESPQKRRMADADSLGSSPSCRSYRKVELVVQVMMREVQALLAGNRNMLKEMARVTETQVTTEKNANAIASKIDTVLTEVRAKKRNLSEGNREMFMEMIAQQGKVGNTSATRKPVKTHLLERQNKAFGELSIGWARFTKMCE